MALRWVQFPLHPDTPAAGLALADLFKGRDLTGMHKQMQARMAAAGLEWAETREGGAAIHMALFRAYFVFSRNLADIDVLLDIAGSVGLDTGEARNVLEQRTFREQVDGDWQYCYDIGITGVPSFLAQNQLVVGCQSYEVLERFVQQLQGEIRDH